MKTIKNVLLLLTLSLVGSMGVWAEAPQAALKQINKSNLDLLNIAGQQRMLSQRIAKNFFYIGKGVSVAKAKRQLKAALSAFENNLNTIKNSVNDEEVQNMIAFIEMSKEDFYTIASEKYNLDNGALALDLSESMLEGSQFVVDAIKKMSKAQASSMVALAGKQRMLSQRIAKYYISYQSGIKDKNSIDQMNKAVEEFSKIHSTLLANKSNTAEINKELQKIDRLWKIVYKFYLNIEKGGLPVIVYNTTDEIMKRMDKITKLYTEIYK